MCKAFSPSLGHLHRVPEQQTLECSLTEAFASKDRPLFQVFYGDRLGMESIKLADVVNDEMPARHDAASQAALK